MVLFRVVDPSRTVVVTEQVNELLTVSIWCHLLVVCCCVMPKQTGENRVTEVPPHCCCPGVCTRLGCRYRDILTNMVQNGCAKGE